MIVNLSDIDLSAWRDHSQKVDAWRRELNDKWETPERWKIIRRYYKYVEPHILSGLAFCPYELGLGDKLTPIEISLWAELRGEGLPFYLQYPVGRRFVDFGDPVKKIAIEADGAAYHTPEGDRKKNEELQSHGWRVIRVKGRDAVREKFCLRRIHDEYGISHDERYYESEEQ
tara:strand:+ start:145 stop:660 length:516 start_codon:yes stop_codon:yes gene_type:complete